jgi:hypothetical protein
MKPLLNFSLKLSLVWTFLACNWAINTWAKWNFNCGDPLSKFHFPILFHLSSFLHLGGMIHLKQNVECKKLIITSTINYPKLNQLLVIGIQRDETKNQPWTLETLDHFDKDACKQTFVSPKRWNRSKQNLYENFGLICKDTCMQILIPRWILFHYILVNWSLTHP